MSAFNFQVQAVLNTDSSTFNQNYFAFLNAIASAAQVPLGAVTVLSVVYGSVTVTLLVSTSNAPASPAAIAQQSALQSALTGSIAGMPVQSASVSTNGGSNDSDDNDDDDNGSSSGGLSKTAIIIIAVFVPVIAIRTPSLTQSSSAAWLCFTASARTQTRPPPNSAPSTSTPESETTTDHAFNLFCALV